MKFFILNLWERLREWTLKWAHSKHMAAALFFIAFTEASFFPLPVDILMVTILLINAERWRFYAGITFIGSILGALLGYLVGFGFYMIIGQKIVDAYNLQAAVDFIGLKYSQHVFLTVFIGALTPIIPFKVIAISAGLFKVSIYKMIAAAIVGRTIRYFGVAYMVKVFGKRMKYLVFRYFKIFSAILALVLVIIFIFLKISF